MYQTTIRRLFVAAAFLAFNVSAASAEQRGVADSEIRKPCDFALLTGRLSDTEFVLFSIITCHLNKRLRNLP